MISIPALAEKDLRRTLEGDFRVPVTLIAPDGVQYAQTADGQPLGGFVRHSYKDTRDKGKEIIVDNPVVILRLASLPCPIATGEKWRVGIPENPRPAAAQVLFSIDPSYAVETNRDTGMVKLHLVKLKGGAEAGA
jgi:hypothetical protein